MKVFFEYLITKILHFVSLMRHLQAIPSPFMSSPFVCCLCRIVLVDCDVCYCHAFISLQFPVGFTHLVFPLLQAIIHQKFCLHLCCHLFSPLQLLPAKLHHHLHHQDIWIIFSVLTVCIIFWFLY